MVVKSRDTAGKQIKVTCEVQQLWGNSRVRVVALGDTDGLMRGMECSEHNSVTRATMGYHCKCLNRKR